MVTTNTASHRLPQTYIQLAEECAKLLKIAEKLAHIARNNNAFSDDAEFQKLRTEFSRTLVAEVLPRTSC